VVQRPGYITDVFGNEAVQVIEAAGEQPFFLSLHFTAPHWPWEGREDQALARRIDNSLHYDGGNLTKFREMVEAMDQNVAKVLDALERSGKADNTIIVFTSDNGGERFSDTWPYIGRKGEVLEGGIRVPLLMSWPRKIKAGGHAEAGFCFDFDTWMPLEQFSAIHNQPIATKNNGYDGLDAEVTFHKTRFVDFMKEWKKLHEEGIARVQTAQTGKTLNQAFADGTCASILTSVANHGVIGQTATPGLNWGVAMLPVYEGTKRQNSLVGGASLWIMAGKSKEEYEAAAAYLAFLAKPEEALWFSTVTGYIPIRTSGYKYLMDNKFYEDKKYSGRELAIESLTATPPSPLSRGIRLGNFTQIRAEIRAELEAAFTGKKEMQQALNDAADRSNQILRRFEQTMRGRQLP
jgi:hypothetical protein